MKPLQISDLKKLQPYLLKSLDQHSSSDSIIDSSNNLVVEEIRDDQHKSADEISKGCMMNNTNASSMSKRKAVPTETSERIPKMKGLVVA